jgi:hypothetical protein
MKSNQCELCSVDKAVPDGVLCAACREAIVRLLAIQESGRPENNDGDQLEEVVVYPERTINTRRAGS